VHSDYAYLIVRREKKVEIRRRTIPENRPILIYSTAPECKVIGIAKMKYIGPLIEWTPEIGELARITKDKFYEYKGSKPFVHIYEIVHAVKRYPTELKEFGLSKGPQFYARAKKIPAGWL